MENSVVLFDISLEISLTQFHNGKNVHAQKVACPWARPRAFYPRLNGKCNDTRCIQGVLEASEIGEFSV